LIPKVPENCMICGAPWMGGCQVPGERYPRKGLRVFYRCGASLSVVDMEKEIHPLYKDPEPGQIALEMPEDYCFFLRLKNCNSRNSDWEYEKAQQIQEGILNADLGV